MLKVIFSLSVFIIIFVVIFDTMYYLEMIWWYKIEIKLCWMLWGRENEIFFSFWLVWCHDVRFHPHIQYHFLRWYVRKRNDIACQIDKGFLISLLLLSLLKSAAHSSFFMRYWVVALAYDSSPKLFDIHALFSLFMDQLQKIIMMIIIIWWLMYQLSPLVDV